MTSDTPSMRAAKKLQSVARNYFGTAAEIAEIIESECRVGELMEFTKAVIEFQAAYADEGSSWFCRELRMLAVHAEAIRSGMLEQK